MLITLIGSARFVNDFIEWNEKLTRFGHTVYSLGFHRPVSDYVSKKVLDAVHLSKIQNSGAVVLINGPQDYIGDSTLGELLFALLTSKPVYVTHEIKTARDWGIGSYYVKGANALLGWNALVTLITEHKDQASVDQFAPLQELGPVPVPQELTDPQLP